MIQRNIISQETRSAGSVTTSSDLATPFMITKYKYIKNLSMRVISTICRTRKLGCYSPTNDTKCQHRSSCTLTSSQPLMTRTITSPSYCPVWPCYASLPFIPNCESSIHHTRAKKIFVLSWTISYNCTRV